jgi:hypothetical protein
MKQPNVTPPTMPSQIDILPVSLSAGSLTWARPKAQIPVGDRGIRQWAAVER